MPNKTLVGSSFFLFVLLAVLSYPAFSQDILSETSKEVNNSRSADIDMYEPYRCLKIRNIMVRVLEPGGSSLELSRLDTIAEKKLLVNKLHSKSNERLVRGLMPFHKGDYFEPEQIVDYLKLLRDKSAYSDARIFVKPVEGTEYVDLDVYVQDKFVLGIGGGLAQDGVYAKVSFNNFLGLGHKVSVKGQFNYDLENPFAVSGKYKVENIFNKRIDFTADYWYDKKYKEVGVEVEREFKTMEDKWAGRVETYWNFNRVDLKRYGLNDQALNFNYQDIWLANAYDPKFLKRMGNYARLISSVRAYREVYSQSPSLDDDNQFKNHGYVLGSIGVANLDYYENRNIYYMGRSEYLPKGISFATIAGLSFQEVYREHFYAGFKINYGHYFKRGGYIFSELSNGNYFNSDGFDKGAVKLGFRYFTNPLQAGKYSIRQFISVYSCLGINRPEDQTYEFYDEKGVRGLDSKSLIGMKGIAMNLETAVTNPFKVAGFRSQTFVFANFAMVGQGDHIRDLATSTLHKGIGIGLRVTHKKLGIGFAEFSFTYYPNDYPDAKQFGYWLDTRNEKYIRNHNLYSPQVLKVE